MEPNKRAPAFQMYPQDFISSLDVQTMTAAQVGAYCLLLFNSWTQAKQAYIPNNERQLQHISRLNPEEWKQSRKLLLSKFPATPDGKFRYNPRLAAEAEKQAGFRAKQAENGKRGGRPKREEDLAKPAESQENPGLSGGLILLNPEKALPSSIFHLPSSSSEIEDTTSPLRSEVDAPADDVSLSTPKDLPAESPSEAAASAPHTRGAADVGTRIKPAAKAPLQFLAFAQSAYATPEGLAALAVELKLPDANVDYYLKQIGLKAGREDNRTPEAWHSYAARWLRNEANRGQLITNTTVLSPQANAITRATPTGPYGRPLSGAQARLHVPAVGPEGYGTL